MIYFSDEEVKVIREMIEYYDSCDSEIIPRECAELIGAIRFKVDSEKVYDFKNTEDTEDTEESVAE